MVSYALSGNLTANPGDRIIRESQTIEEKAQQVAVDKYDITGNHIRIPTYFIFTYPNGETKALHHVRDAKKISDAIRMMHLEEEVDSNQNVDHHSNLNGLVSIVALSLLVLFVITLTILIGVF